MPPFPNIFSHPLVADFYLITFTHSYPSCVLLSTVAETVSHFKECESSFKKTLPLFNLPNQCQSRPSSLFLPPPPPLTPSQEVVVEISASSNYYKLIIFS